MFEREEIKILNVGISANSLCVREKIKKKVLFVGIDAGREREREREREGLTFGEPKKTRFFLLIGGEAPPLAQQKKRRSTRDDGGISLLSSFPTTKPRIQTSKQSNLYRSGNGLDLTRSTFVNPSGSPAYLNFLYFH